MIDIGRVRLFGREWSSHAEALADRFRVVVPDLRGHGRSEVPDKGDTPPEVADDLAALIPARSAAYETQGARAAADFVADAFSPHAPPGPRTAHVRTAHVRTMLGTPDHVIAQSYAGMCTDAGAVGVRPHSEAPLRRRTQPALPVWTSTEAAAWERGLPAAPVSRVEHWPDTGHYLHEERHERTVRLIGDWAAR